MNTFFYPVIPSYFVASENTHKKVPMDIDLNWLWAGLGTAATSFATWIFARRKNNAEAQITEIEAVDSALAIWRQTSEQLKSDISIMRADFKTMQDEIISLKNRNGELENQLSLMRERNSLLHTEIEELRTENTLLKRRISDLSNSSKYNKISRS